MADHSPVPFNRDDWNAAFKAYDEAMAADANDQLGALAAAFAVLASEPVAWAREVDINGPCLVLPCFLRERDVAIFKAQPGNRDAVFRPLYAAAIRNLKAGE